MKFLLALLAPTLLTVYAATSYTVTDDYSVKFSTKKAEGTFSGLAGIVRFSPDDLAGSLFDVYVETASIETGNKTKDKHARGEAWLNAEDNPRITFKSADFTKNDNGYSVSGALSINGVTQKVIIPFSFSDLVFTGELTVNRDDYGIEGPFLFGGLVGDDITVSLRIPVEE